MNYQERGANIVLAAVNVDDIVMVSQNVDERKHLKTESLN